MRVGDWLRRMLSVPPPEPQAAPAPAPPAGGQRRPAELPEVDAAVEVMLSHPEADQDQMLALLQGCGFTSPEAWRVYQFLPIAFAHIVFRDRGVKFQPEYVLMDPDSGVRSTHRLADEPLYTSGLAVAEDRVAKGYSLQQLLPVFVRSAEWDVIRQLVGPDGRLDGVVFTEPLLMTYGGS